MKGIPSLVKDSDEWIIIMLKAAEYSGSEHK